MMLKTNKSAMVLYFTIAGVMMGFGIIIPVIPFLIKHFGGSGKEIGALISIYAVMQFIFAPIWGVLSDRLGRRPVLIIGVVGNALSHLFFALSTDIWMLLVARGLAGILSSATLPTAMAYIGDISSPEDRGGSMGKLAAAMGAGMIFGPGIGGFMAEISLAAPFFMASAISAAALIPIWIYLPESLPVESRIHQSVGSVAAQFRSMRKALSGPLAFPLILALLLDLSMMIFEGVFGLFALDVYGYGPTQVGTVLFMAGVIGVIMQGVLSGPLTKRWGERAVITVSMLFTAVGFPLMLFPQSSFGIMATIAFFIVSNSLLRPSVSAHISKLAPGGQGEAMGLNQSFMGLGRIIGPMLGGFLYDFDFSWPYLWGGGIMFLGFFACLVWLKEQNRPVASPKN